MIYQFGDCELDEGMYELRRAGAPQKLSPKSFDLLRLLVRSGGRVVSKAELFDAIWPAEHVGDSVLPVNVTAVRKALGADAGMIRTVHGRGYRFVGDVEAKPAPREHEAQERPLLVGRDDVIAEIDACMRKSLAGERWIVLVEGEPGIGKSRLLEEIRDRATALGASALVGRCHGGAGAPAFWPWMQIRRGGKPFLEIIAERREGHAVRLREIARSMGRLTRLADTEVIPTAYRFQLFALTTQFIETATAHAPLVLLFDDLHDADESSLELLRHVAFETSNVPLLLVGAYRDTDLRRTHSLADTLAALTHDANCARLSLRGLDDTAVEHLVRAVSGTQPSERFTRELIDMTEGNPFFIHETLRLLASRNLDPATAEDPRQLGLPRGIRELVGQRLNTLSEACNELLRLASVLGRLFEIRMLATVAEQPEARVSDLLDEAMRAGLVSAIPRRRDRAAGAGGAGVFRFSHSLVRETLYEEVSGPHRVLLHARVVDALEDRRTPSGRRRLSELAHHAFQAAPAGDIDKAVHYCMQAAHESLSRAAFEQATRYIEWAGRAADLRIPANDRQKAYIDLGMGHALWRCRDYDRARDHFFRCADTARAIGDTQLLALSALGMSSWPQFLYRFHRPESNVRTGALLAEALRELGDGRADIRSALLAALVGSGEPGDSLRSRSALAREAVSLARRSGNRGALFQALRARVTALTDPRMIRERLRTCRELLQVSQQVGSRTSLFLAHEARALGLLSMGKIARADDEMAQAERIAEGMQLPAFDYSTLRYRLARALADGRFEEARALRRRIPEAGATAGDVAARIVAIAIDHWILLPEGRLPTIAGNIETAYRSGRLPYSAATACFSYFFARLGNGPLARQTFEAIAREDFEMLSDDDDLIWTLSVCADACIYQGDRKAAISLYRRLEPFAELNVVRPHLRLYRGAAAHFLGLLASLIGDRALARDHFENALEMNRAMGALPALVETQARYASFLRKGGGSERARAQALETEAERTARQLGMIVAPEPDPRILEDATRAP